MPVHSTPWHCACAHHLRLRLFVLKECNCSLRSCFTRQRRELQGQLQGGIEMPDKKGNQGNKDKGGKQASGGGGQSGGQHGGSRQGQGGGGQSGGRSGNR